MTSSMIFDKCHEPLVEVLPPLSLSEMEVGPQDIGSIATRFLGKVEVLVL